MSLPKDNTYAFADFIRFVAMCAIIFQHSFLVDKVLLATDPLSYFVFYSLKVAAKIGSISFFTVSGFLLSSALDRYTAREYLNKRVRSIFKPYLLFVLLYLIIDSAGAFYGAKKISTLSEFPMFVVEKIITILFFTSYWFIFNYFISVSILLLLRKYLYSLGLGFVLLACTLLYSVNVYYEWFPPHHTSAFIGFTFFLWLGANLKRNEEWFWGFIEHTKLSVIIVFVLLALCLDLLETYYLMHLGATVTDSSLKVTNVFYALIVFILLCKIGSEIRFKWLNPREETYPLYLVHPIFLKVINYALLPMLPAVASVVTLKNPAQVTWVSILVYQVGWFFIIYGLSLVTVKFVLRTRFKWIFGG